MGLSAGLGSVVSNARTVSDYGGVFGEVGVSAGAPVGVAASVATGTASDGYRVIVISPEATVGARGLTFLGVAPLPWSMFGGATDTIYQRIE